MRQVDYIVKEKLFNFFMLNKCITGTPEHKLLEWIVVENPWPRPIAVMGYDDTWALAGDVRKHNLKPREPQHENYWKAQSDAVVYSLSSHATEGLLVLVAAVRG
jgi:hypothetical protein